MSQSQQPPLIEEPSKERRYLLTFGRTLAYLAYAYVILVEIILGLGFILQLFGASPSAGFVRWVYRSMDSAMEPFRGIFPSVDIGGTSADRPQAVLNTSVLFAMLVYAIVAWAIHLAIFWFTRRLRRLEQERQDTINRQTYLAASGVTAAASPAQPQQPQYQQPQYETPQYGTPQYRTPQYGEQPYQQPGDYRQQGPGAGQ